MAYELYKGIWQDKDNIVSSKKLSKAQCEAMLRRGGYLVRCISNFDKKEPTYFWFVIKDSFMGIDELSSKKRNQVRKSQKIYDFKIVKKEELLNHGLEINNKALGSYKVKASTLSKEQFRQFVERGNSVDYWMVYEKETGIAVAFGINTLYDDYCDYSVLKADPAYLNHTYPYYGLIFEMNRYYLEEKGYKFVCDGARSITEHSNIQPFLIETFNFRKAYCDLSIYYKGWLRIAVKMLYPFRKIIKQRQITSVLRQESWSRGIVD